VVVSEDRDSMTGQWRAFPRAWKALTLVGGAALCVGSAGATVGFRYGTVPTRAEVSALSEREDARYTAMHNLLGTPPQTTLAEPTVVPIFTRLQRINDGDTAQVERVGLVVREYVGVRVALHRVLQMPPSTKLQRETSQRAAIAARDRFDHFVMRLSPNDAANKVLEEAGVPR
jgi:hypothetical protein